MLTKRKQRAPLLQPFRGMRILPALISLVLLSGCGVHVGKNDFNWRGMCTLALRASARIQVSSSAAIDKTRIQLWESYNGGAFEESSESPIPDTQSNSVSWFSFDNRPGTHDYKVVYLNQETPAQRVILGSEDFGECGFQGVPGLLNFNLN